MKFKTVMAIKAIACMVFGPLLLFVPEWSLNIPGTTLGSGTSLTAREYGAALIGTLLLTWLVRNAEDSVTRRIEFLYLKKILKKLILVI